MPQLNTKFFGRVEYQDQSVFDFPAGVPGFEEEKRFLLLEQHENRPLVFLQSLSQPELCFLALPVLCVDPDYRLSLEVEDLHNLELPADHQPRIGGNMLCLALLSLEEDQPPTANLLAPIVVNLQ